MKILMHTKHPHQVPKQRKNNLKKSYKIARQNVKLGFFEHCARLSQSFPAKMTTNQPEVKVIMRTRLQDKASGFKPN